MLFLHIGTHKTGTSALQTFLTRRGADLDRCGVHYVRAGLGQGIAHHSLSWAVRGQYIGENAVWDEARAEIAAHRHMPTAMSSEAFWFTDPEKLQPELKDAGPIRIVAYLRRQDRYLQSLYKQAVTGGRPQSFEDWYARTGKRGDYLSIVRRWAEVFGPENIMLRPYDRAGGRIDVTEDFFSAVGVDVASLLAQRKRQSHNPSPRLELLELYRAVNQSGIELPRDKLFWPVMGGHQEYHRSADILDYERSAQLLKDFADSNAALEREFNRDPSTPLFPELVPFELPEFWDWRRPEYQRMAAEFMDALIKAARSGETRSDNERKNKKPRDARVSREERVARRKAARAKAGESGGDDGEGGEA